MFAARYAVNGVRNLRNDVAFTCACCCLNNAWLSRLPDPLDYLVVRFLLIRS